MNTGTLRGQSEIAVENRRQREGAFQERQVNEQEVLGLGSTEAAQEYDSEEDYHVTLSRKKRARLEENQRESSPARNVNVESENDLPPTLEKANERGGELTEEVIVVDNKIRRFRDLMSQEMRRWCPTRVPHISIHLPKPLYHPCQQLMIP